MKYNIKFIETICNFIMIEVDNNRYDLYYDFQSYVLQKKLKNKSFIASDRKINKLKLVDEFIIDKQTLIKEYDYIYYDHNSNFDSIQICKTELFNLFKKYPNKLYLYENSKKSSNKKAC